MVQMKCLQTHPVWLLWSDPTLASPKGSTLRLFMSSVLSSRSQKRHPWMKTPLQLNWTRVEIRLHKVEAEDASPRHLAISLVTWKSLPTGLKVSTPPWRSGVGGDGLLVLLLKSLVILPYLLLLFFPFFLNFLPSNLRTSSILFLFNGDSGPVHVRGRHLVPPCNFGA